MRHFKGIIFLILAAPAFVVGLLWGSIKIGFDAGTEAVEIFVESTANKNKD